MRYRWRWDVCRVYILGLLLVIVDIMLAIIKIKLLRSCFAQSKASFQPLLNSCVCSV